MLNGDEPEICKKCYDIERAGGWSNRQRTLDDCNIEELVSNTDTSTGELHELTLNSVHLQWGNKCNLKCKMCSPDASDQLIDEFDAMGIPVSGQARGTEFDWSFEANREVLEKIAPHITMLNVTGGEPLINTEFLDYCKYLTTNGYSKNIGLAFHTNLTVLPGKFTDRWEDFKWVHVKLSIDATEQDYEYIRYPGKWNTILRNIDGLIGIIDRLRTVSADVHTVFSSFNAHAIPNLIAHLATIDHPRFTNFPHTIWVTWPQYADAKCLPVEVKTQITTACLAAIDQYPSNRSKRVADNIATLVSNLTIMNEANQHPETFIQFNLKQDQYRSVKTENVIKWFNSVP